MKYLTFQHAIPSPHTHFCDIYYYVLQYSANILNAGLSTKQKYKTNNTQLIINFSNTFMNEINLQHLTNNKCFTF